MIDPGSLSPGSRQHYGDVSVIKHHSCKNIMLAKIRVWGKVIFAN